MNTVTLNSSSTPAPEILPGAWFVDDVKQLFILATVGRNKYACIRITDGNYWDGPADSIDGATNGLKLVAHSARVEVTP